MQLWCKRCFIASLVVSTSLPSDTNGSESYWWFPTLRVTITILRFRREHIYARLWSYVRSPAGTPSGKPQLFSQPGMSGRRVAAITVSGAVWWTLSSSSPWWSGHGHQFTNAPALAHAHAYYFSGNFRIPVIDMCVCISIYIYIYTTCVVIMKVLALCGL